MVIQFQQSLLKLMQLARWAAFIDFDKWILLITMHFFNILY
jgi:hypothetical protein